MKLNEIQNIIDLSSKPSSAVVMKLKKGDFVLYENNQQIIEIPPKKLQRGIWIVGLRDKKNNNHYVKIYEDLRPSMTSMDKRAMKNNIKKIVKDNAANDKKLLALAKTYYENLYNHNRYDESDVRECMSLFPVEILKKSGIPL